MSFIPHANPRAALTLALTAALAACVAAPDGSAPRPGTATAPTGKPYRPQPTAPVRQPTPSVPLPPAPAATITGAGTAATAGLTPGPALASLPLDAANATRALAAFRTSCPSLVRKADPSGLTTGADWRGACDAAASADGDPVGFFQRWFEPVQVGDGRAFATGYYVPEIAAARTRRPGYEVPIYARPDDLVDVDLGRFSDSLKGRKIRGRVEGSNFVPYFDRTRIEEGVLDGKARVLAWAADPVALFFLQVQGSGLLRLPDGEVMRIGYATQNGRDYTGIGKLMRDRGLVGPGQANMQGLVAWLHANPEQGRAVMRENKSYVFFRELNGPPLGAMGLPVAEAATVAADVNFVPLGAPVYLSMDRSDANGLWVAQDTGGAIKGTNRFDTFWGAGPQAEAIAGGMSARGTAFLLLPVGTLAKLGARPPLTGVAGAPPRR